MPKDGLHATGIGTMSILTDIQAGADTLVIHFSSRNKGAGKFHRYPTPANVSNVYINPADLNWYLDGLPDLQGLDRTVIRLRSIIEESRASRVICMGSSMGAWGAAYMAPMLGAQKAILFGPELRLNCFASYSAENISHRASEIPSISPDPSCEYVVIAGMNSPCDIYGTVSFFGGGAMPDCYFLPLMGHATAHDLNQIGLLDGILEGLVHDHPTRPVLDAMRYKDHAALSEFFLNRPYDFQAITDYIDRFVPTKHATKFVAGVAGDLITKKLFPHAFNLLWKVYQDGAMPNDLKILLLRSARKAKRNAQALKVAEELAQVPTYRRDALWEKALVLERLNRADESCAALTTLCREHLEDPIYKTAASKVSSAAFVSPAY